MRVAMAKKGRVRKTASYVGLTAIAGALLFGGYLGMLQLTGNFHTVIPGQLYRSAQPTSAQLESYIKEYGIKTIVNLRGKADRDWYVDETAVASRLGVQHIDFGMSATKKLSVDRSMALIDIMKSAPKPILVHCLSGADRTGLFSVIYSQQIAGIEEKEAEWQLSFLFGHVAIPYVSASFAMDSSWHDLENHLATKERG
jgi:protein tyrosine/serine phosphatase